MITAPRPQESNQLHHICSKLTSTHIEAHGVQVHLSELDVFVVLCHLTAFPQEQTVRHPPAETAHHQQRQREEEQERTVMKTTEEEERTASDENHRRRRRLT